MKRSILLVVALSGCARGPASPPLPTEAEWTKARAWLHDLRAGVPEKPFGAVVRVTLHEPHTGRAFTARGAVAVDPHHALRMILLGPGGTTAIDVWATPDRWRFEVPAANILRRGGRDEDASLPVGFFRWWFLEPLDGRLLTSVAVPDGQRLILRQHRATIDLTDTPIPSGHAVLATRTLDGAVDRVDFRAAKFAASAGDRATYDEEQSGVHVDVVVESPSDPPDPLAFVDPDSAEGRRANAP